MFLKWGIGIGGEGVRESLEGIIILYVFKNIGLIFCIFRFGLTSDVSVIFLI